MQRTTSMTFYLRLMTGIHDQPPFLPFLVDFINFVDFRYGFNEDYDMMPDKRARGGFGHALRIRRGDESFSHALRIRASPYGHALRIKKGGNFNHALRIRASPYGHALRIKKGDEMFSHALRIRASPYQHALRVRRAEAVPEDDFEAGVDYPDYFKRAMAFNHVLRVR